MDSNQRATVAFLCGCLKNDSKRFTSVYDYTQGTYVSCSYSNSGGNISIYDYRRSCYLTGRSSSFFDYGVSQYLAVNRINDNLFSVYDYHSSSYCSITCNGQFISLYDYSEGKYFSYYIN